MLGGARSGKSSFAQARAAAGRAPVLFVATAEGGDDEMKRRIARHRRERPRGWRTREAPRDLAAILDKSLPSSGTVLVDCLTLYLSNLLCGGQSEARILAEVGRLLRILRRASCDTILVANEVGEGIVPVNELARRFRDVAGRANQRAAAAADEVYVLHAGIAMRIK